MANFVYEPLDTCTFRLLRLFKGRKHYDDRVCCELYEAPHPSEIDDDEDVYEALSYTWGNPDDTEPSPDETKDILMNDHQVPVTKNLYNALYHLRYPGEDRIIWVDALCINQRDASERSLQVRQMCVIYSKAKSVIIWLGESSEGIKLLMEGVRELDRRILRRPKPQEKDRLDVWYDEGRSFVRNMAASNYQVRREALEKLMKRSWFRRVWVVQEAAVASRATIQCSWESAPTRTFALMPELMDVKPQNRARTLLEVMPGPCREQSWWRKDRRFNTLLQKFGWFEATDERDKIFALLGISVDTAVADCPLKVDYDADMAEVCRRTISFLACGDILDVVTYSSPVWPLKELRRMLPSLRKNVFEWALRTEGSHAPLLRRLIHGMPRIDINVPLDDGGSYPVMVLIDKENSAEDFGALLDFTHRDAAELTSSVYSWDDKT
ncbi:hypothetical protein CkaCkLH20_00994 [Colletotrichum karsti]|uniref:Heterokaryon incompatibility domain-containing protein n=1 Tax=Colletotrichum karsti TaxID=1095194 RepID=A0A9P6LQ34_9PEZI|nr:uncharacterized protein CkaCkLH20_00994 [Colletotrichum karsti]KAF9881848.1 hypothetical protein CkaCkLH20_00994 [Colletotrichum karsti]